MGSIILDIVYGYETKPKDDEWVALADLVVKDLADSVRYCVQTLHWSLEAHPTCRRPGKWLVDVIPPCWFYFCSRELAFEYEISPVRYLPDWMPGAGFKKEARRMVNTAHKLVNEQVGVIPSLC